MGEYNRPYAIDGVFSEGIVHPLNCAILGYPSEFMRMDPIQGGLVMETYFHTMPLVRPSEWPPGIVDDGKDPTTHFLLYYNSKSGGRVTGLMDGRTEPINPNGMSGAGVWVFDVTRENHENPSYSLFGIQTGMYRQQGMLVGTFVSSFFPGLEKQFGISVPRIRSPYA